MINMAEKVGKIGAVYAASGAGVAVANESVVLVGGVKSLANTNVLVSKVTSDAGGATPITKSWYCTVKGSLNVTDGGTDTVYVTYKYWRAGTYGKGSRSIWVKETGYSLDDIVIPTTENDFYYKCTTAGTSGTDEPTWNTVDGETTEDPTGDTLIWTTYAYEVGQVAGFFGWGIDKVGDALETTDYSDAGHRTYISGLKGWTGSAERHWLTEEPLEWINTKLIVKFYVDVSNTLRYEGWGLVIGHGVTSTVDTLVNESLSFQGDSVLTYEES